MTKDNSPFHNKASYKGVIIFAVIALFIYGAWTKARVDDYLIDAIDVYEKNWTAACKMTAKTEREGYADCINDPNEIARNCKSFWNPKRDASANCALPTKTAEYVNSQLEKVKNFCVSYG